MKQRTLTQIGRLRIGDRFYFASDKKKEVCLLVSFSTGIAYYSNVQSNKPANQWLFNKKTGENKEVIFCRHSIQEALPL